MGHSTRLAIVLVAAGMTAPSARPQVGPEPLPLPDSETGQQLHGPSGANEWTYHAKLCKEATRCPTRTSLPDSMTTGASCSYCDLNIMQRRCWGREGDCTQVKYTTASAPPSCGVFWYGGTVDIYGNCVGAVASSTQICYRISCTSVNPGTP